MEIHLIRHTKVNIPNGICYGQSDVALANSFESELLGIDFSEKYAQIYSSPLTRCKQLAEKFSPDFKIEKNWMEMNFGDWELQTWDEIPKIEIQPWFDDFIHTSPPNGESLIQMRNRIITSFQELYIRHQNEKILIVTHAGCIRIIINFLQKIPIEELFSTEVNHGQLFNLKVSAATFQDNF